jgi:hypothetical protein
MLIDATRLTVTKSDECGCPEEEWDIDGVFTTIHLDEDGGGGIFISGDGWEDEKLIPNCTSMRDLLAAAIEWISTLPKEEP